MTRIRSFIKIDDERRAGKDENGDDRPSGGRPSGVRCMDNAPRSGWLEMT